MAVTMEALFLNFALSLVVSTLAIFIVVKLFHEEEGITTALVAAFIGSIIYSIAYYVLGTGLVAAAFGGLAWLAALGNLYKMGWLKAFFVALAVWILVSLLSFLPSVIGPL